MKGLKLFILFLVINTAFACSDRNAEVKEIWLSQDLEWNTSETGLPEIDTIRKEAYTQILLFYGDKVAFGNISLYQHLETDTIMLAYEAGEMLFSEVKCEPTGDLVSEGENRLKYENQLFIRASNFSQQSRKELAKELRKYCK